MAKALAWTDLTEQDLMHILKTSNSPSDTRRNLACVMKLNDTDDPSRILLDLHYSSFLFTQEQGFSLEKTSTFISIMKVVHEQAIENHYTVERSWEKTKELLMRHSVQRPPFSICLFTFGDLQEIIRYMLNTYYRHFKLYQYAFNPTFYLDLEAVDYNLVELAPSVPPLSDAITQADYDIEQEKIRKALEEEAVKREQERLVLEEAERKAKIEEEYRAAIPDEVTQKVTEAVNRHMEQLRLEFERKVKEEEDKLLEKLSNQVKPKK